MSYSTALPWALENIDFDRIEKDRVRHNEDLFLLLCSSSFVESGSDLYTHNLVDHFDSDPELRAWLNAHWEQEELQHGRALAAYVRHVWPEFDWHAGFKSFWREYGAVCTSEELEADRGLELVARCVVETGTASLYRALNEITDEPVLKQLTHLLKTDEVRHYKHFYHAFRRYRELHGFSRYAVFRAMLKRVREIKSEDSDIALRHVFNLRYPELAHNDHAFRRVAHRAEGLLRRNMPAEMLIKMLIKPLDLSPRLQRWITAPLTHITKRMLLH